MKKETMRAVELKHRLQKKAMRKFASLSERQQQRLLQKNYDQMRRPNSPNTVVEGWKDAVCKDFKVSGEKNAGVYYAKKAEKILRGL